MQKIVLYIKNSDDVYKRVDMFNDETISLTSKIQDVRDIGKVFTDFSQTFTVPASKENNKIFKHWYDSSIDNGFDARNRKEAVMELDFNPFRRGKISLNNAKMKNNSVFSYELIFYGNTVNLKDLMKEDELNVLTSLDDDFTHNYDSTEVRLGFRSGLFSQSIIYPLITHTKRLYYDSSNDYAQYSGNLYYSSTNTSDNQGLAFDDLKPAIKCLDIIEAIESKYTIANGFTSDIIFTRDFFGSTAFSNLYLWLSRNSGAIGGDENQQTLLTRIIGDWGHVSGYTEFNVSGKLWTFSVVKNTNSFTADLQITTTNTNPYTLRVVDVNTSAVIFEEIDLFGTQTINLDFINTISHSLRFILESEYSITFQSQLTIEETNLSVSPPTTNTGIYDINGNDSSISTINEIVITDNVPEIKNIDFLTGLFKMFNLTAYYIDDLADADFGKIYVDTLDNFYADRLNNPSEGNYDITKHVDTSTSVIARAFEYNEIDFNYEEPSTLLSINHQEQFNDIFGNEQVNPEYVDRGTKYSVDVPFEHMKLERIYDNNKTSTSPYYTGTDDNYVTDILWGYSAANEFNGDFNPKAQGAATSTSSYKLVDTNRVFTDNISSGDIVRNLTDNTSAIVTAIDSADTLSITKDIMASGESYMILGNYSQGNYEPVLTKPLIFYGIQETVASAKAINWISGTTPVVQYFRPSNTNEDGTNSRNPSDSGTTTSAATNKLIETGQNFLTTVTVGDIVLNTTDNTSSLVTIIDSNTQLTLSLDIMASSEVYKIISPPAYTINFDDEVDEWNLTNYIGTTNSLYKKFYANYIDGIFNEKKRIYKLRTYLPTDILANYRLNDELTIQDMVFRINSISTNFKTEVSQLELLNKL